RNFNSSSAAGVELNESRKCAARGCYEQRRKLGRYCAQHRAAFERSGNISGLCVTYWTWLPFVETAYAFVDQYRDHPSIKAGLEWWTRELRNAEYSPSTTDLHHRRFQAYISRAHKKRGVEPDELLARVIAAELADDRGRDP